ncbi:MAG: hypothetical protein IKE53_06305 [Clostridiales bacterium]|nr:hypothetical protein [Clostridiales bacterium]
MPELLDGKRAVNTVIRRLGISVVFWIIIAILQILGGLFLIVFGYGVSMILCGAWNIYASVSRMKLMDQFKANPELIYPYYERDLNHILIFLGINLIFGGFIGVFASCYDLLIRDYVMKHREDLSIGLNSGDDYGQL